MADVLTPEQRRFNMSRIRSRDTGPELAVRRILRELGYKGYRLNVKGLPGTPDIAFKAYHIAILVHGCYFHRHACHFGSAVPKTNSAFWLAKFEQTVRRDTQKRRALRALGWSVVTIWECELRDAARARLKLKWALSRRGMQPRPARTLGPLAVP